MKKDSENRERGNQDKMVMRFVTKVTNITRELCPSYEKTKLLVWN